MSVETQKVFLPSDTGVFHIDVPMEIYSDQAKKEAFIAKERLRLDRPKPTNRSTDIASIRRSEPRPSGMSQAANLSMEAVTGVNRPFAELLDVVTSPVQYPIAAMQQGTFLPQGGGFFRSKVPEMGEFAGDTALTRIISGASELASMSIPTGMATRGITNLLSETTRVAPNALQRVLRELGRTTPKQDVLFGAASGAGGEAAVETGRMIGMDENEITRFAGQLLSPAALNALSSKLIGLSKNIFRQSAPTLDDLRGLRVGLYGVLDQAGIKQDGPNIKPFIEGINKQISDFTLDASAESSKRGILEGLKRDAEAGELTFSRIYAETKRLRSLKDQNGNPDGVAQKLAFFLDDQLYKFQPLNPGALGNNTFEESVKAAKEAARREINAKKMSQLLQNIDVEEMAGKNYTNVLKDKLKPLIQEGQPEYRYLKPSERQLIQEAIQGKGVGKILNAFSQVGFNSDDLIRSIFYTTLVGAAAGGGAYAAGSSMVLGGTIALGTLIGRGLGNAATKLVKSNARLMESILKAGTSGEKILEGYLKYVPKEKRDARDLAILFKNQRVDLRVIEDIADKSQSQFLKDSVGLAIGLDRVINLEQRMLEQQSGRETGAADVPTTPLGL
tara:strand:- start:46 stop:1896 length:1851 start_codon:yes stop_codon:yes gene_type:complete